MPNPDRAYGYEDDGDNLYTCIVVFLIIIVPVVLALGNLFHWWNYKVETACPYYDSSGELRDDCN